MKKPKDKIEQLEYYEAYAFRLYNFLAKIKFLPHFVSKHSLLKRNNYLKNIETDECIICGNGPSLNEFEFNKVSFMPIFTVNWFHKGNIKPEENFLYHIAIDDAFYKEKEFEMLLDAYRLAPNTKFIVRLSAMRALKTKKIQKERFYYISNKLIQYGDNIQLDMTKNVTACVNTVCAALQCAIFMGYKKIYMIGCESNFNDNYTHFYNNNQKDVPSDWHFSYRWLHIMYNHFDALQHYSEKNSISIFNITPNSSIRSFPKMSLQEFYTEHAIPKRGNIK